MDLHLPYQELEQELAWPFQAQGHTPHGFGPTTFAVQIEARGWPTAESQILEPQVISGHHDVELGQVWLLLQKICRALSRTQTVAWNDNTANHVASGKSLHLQAGENMNQVQQFFFTLNQS